jgi:hypothetical protein
MRWKQAVLFSLQSYGGRHGTRIIDRSSFIAEELDRITSATTSKGATPAQTLSRVLQELRDDHVLEFVGPGKYLLLDAPFDVEYEDLPDEAIDHALRANRLRIGTVPTDTHESIARRRRGQQRLRALTIENYESCCAVCDISDRVLLVASHILGWAEAPMYRGNLANVICLCRVHDALFETGYWSLEDDLVLLKRGRVSSSTLRSILGAMTVFRRPLSHSPDRNFVKVHRERMRLGSAGR